jgi:hypothetical protein
MLMKANRHIEQIVGRVLLMGQNEHLLAADMRRFVIISRTDIGRAALLPRLED